MQCNVGFPSDVDVGLDSPYEYYSYKCDKP